MLVREVPCEEEKDDEEGIQVRNWEATLCYCILLTMIMVIAVRIALG